MLITWNALVTIIGKKPSLEMVEGLSMNIIINQRKRKDGFDVSQGPSICNSSFLRKNITPFQKLNTFSSYAFIFISLALAVTLCEIIILRAIGAETIIIRGGTGDMISVVDPTGYIFFIISLIISAI